MRHPRRFAPTTLGESLCERDGGWFGITEARHRPNELLDPHAHRYPAITVVCQGSFGLRIGRETVDCNPRGVFFKRGGHMHSNLVGHSGSHSLIVELRSDDPCVERNDLPLPDASFWCEDSLARRLAGGISRELRAGDAASHLALEGLVLELIACLLRRPNARSGAQPPWLKEVEAVLRDSFRDAISLTDVAGIVGRHPAHLARTFRRHHGCSLGEYLRRVRLEYAATRLRESDHPIGAIAIDAGFYDHAHFGRCFRRWMSLSPAAYRAAHRG